MSDAVRPGSRATASRTKRTAVLFLHDIDRHYRQGDVTLEILKAPSLRSGRGQSVALVAPSGAGKSTLLHIAGLLEQPDAARSISTDRDLELSDAERTRIRRTEIGFVYQFHHLLPEFSAIENVMLPQMIRGLSRARRTARDRPASAISG